MLKKGKMKIDPVFFIGDTLLFGVSFIGILILLGIDTPLCFLGYIPGAIVSYLVEVFVHYGLIKDVKK